MTTTGTIAGLLFVLLFVLVVYSGFKKQGLKDSLIEIWEWLKKAFTEGKK